MYQRVRLVGAVPKLVPLHGDASGWRLDLGAFEAAVSDRTRVAFLMNPAIPSGWVASEEEWNVVTMLCRERGVTLLYWSLWEAVVFGGRPVVVPSGLEGMRDLTVTAGAVSLVSEMGMSAQQWRSGSVVTMSSSGSATASLSCLHTAVGRPSSTRRRADSAPPSCRSGYSTTRSPQRP